MKSTSPVKTPFQNLKFLIIINKIMGLISCKLVNGRLKPASLWNLCYCVSWILLHCSYTGVTYYKWCTMSHTNTTETLFFLNILRYNAFFVSLLPYHYAAVWHNGNIVKVSALFKLQIVIKCVEKYEISLIMASWKWSTQDFIISHNYVRINQPKLMIFKFLLSMNSLHVFLH